MSLNHYLRQEEQLDSCCEQFLPLNQLDKLRNLIWIVFLFWIFCIKKQNELNVYSNLLDLQFREKKNSEEFYKHMAVNHHSFHSNLLSHITVYLHIHKPAATEMHLYNPNNNIPKTQILSNSQNIANKFRYMSDIENVLFSSSWRL